MKLLKRILSRINAVISPMLMFWTAHLRLAISVVVILVIVVTTYVAWHYGFIDDPGPIKDCSLYR